MYVDILIVKYFGYSEIYNLYSLLGRQQSPNSTWIPFDKGILLR